MARTELLMSVIAGIAGGLTGLVWSRIVSPIWLAGVDPAVQAGREPASHQLAEAVLFAAAGAALGFLFWLGWGLISLVNVRWYVAGLAYGGLAWAGVALPLLGVHALRQAGFARTALVLAVEWLVTCGAVGLSCALAWHRYA